MANDLFDELTNFIQAIPPVNQGICKGLYDDRNWWIKFKIDISHKLAWQAVQEIGFVVNYISTGERLPAKFYPVSPPPYLNGGPDIYLSWVIESSDPEFSPSDLAEWLKSRLPDPVEDEDSWGFEDDEDGN